MLRLVSIPRLVATLISPQILGVLLILDALLLVWRLTAVAHAFFDRRFALRPGWLGYLGLAVIVVFVAIPHLIGYQYGMAAQTAFARIFAPEAQLPGQNAGPTASPSDRERVNILLIGVDSTPTRTTALTDTMMVASLDPVGRTVSLVSVPRDLIGVPLGDGNNFGPKLNSLMSYADTHRKEFPQGGKRALEDAVGALLGIRIQYQATLDFAGFVKMIDAVGGVDVDVKDAFDDPTYDGYGLNRQGWSVTAGPHHFDGLNALAYARSRKATGESDFKRQERQQEILLALRDKVTSGGSLLFNLPNLLDALGAMVHTDFPIGRLPSVAATLDEMGTAGITRTVIRFPLVHGGTNRYGSIQIPDLAAIRVVAAGLFSEPGTPPTPWPTPKPSKAPAASPAP